MVFREISNRRLAKDTVNQQLNLLEEQIKFQQALGGVTISKPFEDIQKTRQLLNERLKFTALDAADLALDFGFKFGAGDAIGTTLLGGVTNIAKKKGRM